MTKNEQKGRPELVTGYERCGHLWVTKNRGMLVGYYQSEELARLAHLAAHGSRETPEVILVTIVGDNPPIRADRHPVQLEKPGEVPDILQFGSSFLAKRGYALSGIRNDFYYAFTKPLAITL